MVAPEILKKLAIENISEKEKYLIFGLSNYLSDFYDRVRLNPQIKKEKRHIKEGIFRTTLGIIAKNNFMAAQYSHPEFDNIIQKCDYRLDPLLQGDDIFPTQASGN